MAENAERQNQLSAVARGPSLVWALAIVAAANAMPLFSDFVLDDFFNLKNALDAGWSWSNLTHGFNISIDHLHDGPDMPAFAGIVIKYFRPLFLSSLLADHALWGLNAFGFHLTDLLLHLAVVAVFYGVLRELIPGRPAMAWFGALLYGVMPFHAMVVGWVSGRTEQIPALAMMVGLWAWLRFAATGQWSLYGASLAAMAIGLLGKENVIVYPALLFAAWVWIVPRPRPAAWVFVPFIVLGAAYLVWRNHVLGGFPLPPPSFYYHSPGEPGFVWWAIAKSICVFFSLLAHATLTYPAEMLLWHHPAILAVAALLTASVATLLFRFVRGDQDDRWRRLSYFAIAWIVVGLLPTAPIFVAQIYFYFPLAGVCLLYLAIWQRMVERGRPRLFVGPRGRRITPVLLVVLGVGFLQITNSLFLLASRRTRSLFHQIVEVAGEPGGWSRMYMIDTPWLALYAKLGLELDYSDRDFEVHLLTSTPYLLKTPTAMSRLEVVDEQTLRLTALQKPYLAGLDGMLGNTDRPPDRICLGQVLEGPNYKATFTKVEPGGLFGLNCVREMVFRFEEPLAKPGSLFLRFANGRFERVDLGGPGIPP